MNESLRRNLKSKLKKFNKPACSQWIYAQNGHHKSTVHCFLWDVSEDDTQCFHIDLSRKVDFNEQRKYVFEFLLEVGITPILSLRDGHNYSGNSEGWCLPSIHLANNMFTWLMEVNLWDCANEKSFFVSTARWVNQGMDEPFRDAINRSIGLISHVGGRHLCLQFDKDVFSVQREENLLQKMRVHPNSRLINQQFIHAFFSFGRALTGGQADLVESCKRLEPFLRIGQLDNPLDTNEYRGGCGGTIFRLKESLEQLKKVYTIHPGLSQNALVLSLEYELTNGKKIHNIKTFAKVFSERLTNGKVYEPGSFKSFAGNVEGRVIYHSVPTIKQTIEQTLLELLEI